MGYMAARRFIIVGGFAALRSATSGCLELGARVVAGAATWAPNSGPQPERSRLERRLPRRSRCDHDESRAVTRAEPRPPEPPGPPGGRTPIDQLVDLVPGPLETDGTTLTYWSILSQAHPRPTGQL